MKTKKLKKYSLHTPSGIYLHFTTNDKNEAIEECNKAICRCEVNELRTPTLFRLIHKNY